MWRKSREKQARKLTVYYAAGPGNVARTYGYWKRGEDDPAEMAKTYSGSVFEICRKNGWRLVIDCDREDNTDVVDGDVEIRSWSVPLIRSYGFRYHAGQMLSGLRMCWRAWRAGADVALVSHGCHWISLLPMRLAGIRVIPLLHCAFWPVGQRPTFWLRRAIQRLDGWFWRHVAEATVCVSVECERQLKVICPDVRGPVFVGGPEYSEETFAGVKGPPAWESGPFTFMYAGRITRDKGVCNLVTAFAEVQRRAKRELRLEICGHGPALGEVRDRVREFGLEKSVILHGRLDRWGMQAVLSRAHASIVSTTKSFAEGVCKAAIEPVIAGRPVICFDVVPLDGIREAVKVVPGDDWGAMGEAMGEFATERRVWESYRGATSYPRASLMNPAVPWQRAVEEAIAAVAPGTQAADSKPQIRIVYYHGRARTLDAYAKWKANQDLPTEVSRTFSSQFHDFCDAIGAHALIVSAPGEVVVHNEGRFSFVYEARGWRDGTGLRYHLAMVAAGLRLLRRARRFGATMLLVDSGACHWFCLCLARLFHFRVVPVMHNCLWPSGFAPRRLPQRVILWLDRFFWRHVPAAVLSVSPEIMRQVDSLRGAKATYPMLRFKAQFRQDFFNEIAPVSRVRKPFRVMYAGRLEVSKGVLDIVEMAEILERKRPGDFVWEICGDGSELARLKEQVSARRLDRIVQVWGRLDRRGMGEAYSRSHAVIAPTRSTFCEGLTMVVIEGVLAGRPVITSRLSNALDDLGSAIVEAQPDDVDSYVDMIKRLADDSCFYESKFAATRDCAQTFVDDAHGFCTALLQMWKRDFEFNRQKSPPREDLRSENICH